MFQLTDITDLQSVLGLPLEEESDSVIALRIPEGQVNIDIKPEFGDFYAQNCHLGM